MSNEIQVREVQAPAPLSPTEVLTQVKLIQDIMSSAMHEGEHYGVIPGCGNKPALLKAGAEKLCLTFRLAPEFAVEIVPMHGDHREYRVQTTLKSILTGAFLGQGVGSCSTMESKYRYRRGEGEDTGKLVPKEYWANRNPELIGGKGFMPKKVDAAWHIFKVTEKAENENLADCYNTVLKMAKKRSLVDAILTVTAASDLFTQDIEEIAENLKAAAPAAEPKPEPKPAKPEKVEPHFGPKDPSPDDEIPFDSNEGTGGKEVAAATAQEDPPNNLATIKSWRDVVIHFGKNKGTRLGDLPERSLGWYAKTSDDGWLARKEADLKNGKKLSEDDLFLCIALKQRNKEISDARGDA